jgi:serine/threonine-protein kinase
MALAPKPSNESAATLLGTGPTAVESAATLLGPTGPAAPAAPPLSLRHSTVLPRVELIGEEHKLVHTDRVRYEAVGKLGEGGIGEVVKVKDNDIGRVVAVKRLRADVKSASALVRFIDEIRTVGELEHPNIVPIHDVGVDENGEYFFVMKYVAGETLETIIEKLAAGDAATHAKYPFERRVAVFESLLEALHYAHSSGIVHRDIKPANVMIGPYGEVMLMDWGIAKRIKGGADETPRAPDGEAPTGRDLFRTRIGSLLGTPAYMSPEQARGEAVDERSDVYSLCVMLHELCCLTHYLADKQTIEAMLDGVIHKAAPLAGSVSSPHQGPTPMDLTWFISKGLAKDPKQRYQSVAEMIERLKRRREGLIPIQCHITFAKRMTSEWMRFIDRHPMLVTVMMGCTLLAAIAFGVRALR